MLNRLGNYVGKAYSHQSGCIVCHKDKIVLNEQFVNIY